MSDLAPFVAAALRDKVVAELQQENAGLQQENAGLRQIVEANRSDIEITGPRGFPTYASMDIDLHVERNSSPILTLDSLMHKSCFLSRLMESEIHIFGRRVTSFSEIVDHGACGVQENNCLKFSRKGILKFLEVQIDFIDNDDFDTLVNDIENGQKSEAFEGDWPSDRCNLGKSLVYFLDFKLSKELWKRTKREKKREMEAATL
jgi:hypothetical protein